MSEKYEVEKYEYNHALKTSEMLEIRFYLNKKHNIYGNWFTKVKDYILIRIYRMIGD